MKRVSARLLCKLLRVTSLALCLLLVLCLDGTVSHADTQVTLNQIRYSLDTSGLTAEVMGGKPVSALKSRKAPKLGLLYYFFLSINNKIV